MEKQTTNGGNNPSETAQALARLARQESNRLQQGAQPAAPADPSTRAQEQPVYDLAARISETAKAIRDLADYSNNVAGDLERITASYIGNMHRLMGKVGK